MSFTLLKQSQRSRSVLSDGSRFLGLIWKAKILSYNRRNMVRVAKSVSSLSLYRWIKKVKFQRFSCQTDPGNTMAEGAFANSFNDATHFD